MPKWTSVALIAAVVVLLSGSILCTCGCKNSAQAQVVTSSLVPPPATNQAQPSRAQRPAQAPTEAAASPAPRALPPTQADKKPLVPPPVRTGPEEPSQDTLCVQERQRVRVDMSDPKALPYVGKSFVMTMLPDPQAPDMSDGQLQQFGFAGTTQGAFDCRIKDQLPAGFRRPDPQRVLSASYLRRRGYPVEDRWETTGDHYTPQFDLTKIPRFTNRNNYASDGAMFEYEGRAAVDVPPCFKSEVTVTPAEIPAGKISDVTLTLTLDAVEPNTWPRGSGITIEGGLPTQVGEAVIAYERPDPVYIKTFKLLDFCGVKAYAIYGGASDRSLPPNFIPNNPGHMKPRPDQDPRLGGVPAKIEFKLHISAPTPGPLRLERVLWCRQSINGVVLPVATASSPQAKDIQYRASASVERFHNVTIMVK